MESNRKQQKLKTNLTLMCVLPATLLLLATSVISVMFTSKNFIGSIKHSLEGQGTSKVSTVVSTLNGSVNATAFPVRAAEIQKYLDEGDSQSVTELLSEIKLRSSLFTAVSLYDLGEKKLYSDDGSRVMDLQSSGMPFWCTEERYLERFNSCQPYFAVQNIAKDHSMCLINYVYPFSSDGSGSPDYCFLVETSNDYVVNALSLNIAISESKWILFNDDVKIIYHAMGYNEEKFAMVENAMKNHRPGLFTQRLTGQRVVIYESSIAELDNMTLLYVVPVGQILKDQMPNLLMGMLVTLVSMLLLVVFLGIMINKIVREINDVRRSIISIKDRKFSGPIIAETDDEIGELVDDVNDVVNTLTFQAEHDENTGFYNAKAFGTRAAERIKNYAGRRTFAIIRVDIDNFSFINDIYDWNIGNSILVRTASIIKNIFGSESVYGYLGNDIFVILFAYKDKNEMIGCIMDAFEQIKLSEKRLPLIAHFGFSDNVQEDSNISVVCDYAGVALKTIKGNMLQVYAEYDDKFKEHHIVQKFVESSKQMALNNHEFFIQLQPKCDITTGEVVGAESLVRWKVASTGVVLPPSKFVHIFEKNGFILALDRYVWEETCKVIRSWHDRGFRDIPVSVNVSRMHINNPGFVDHLYSLVRKYNIRPDLLEIEITESALLNNGEAELAVVMNELKARGFRLLMDDFAQGYSSLLSLQNLPFDVIKIDKALIDHIEKPENARFVSGAVGFLYDLGKEIVVEGVETYQQKVILRDAGCRVIQGFLFSKPLDVNKFEVLAFGGADTGKNNNQ